MIEGNNQNSNVKKQAVEFHELSLPQTKQWVLNWFSLTRQEKRKFDWQSKNVVLYKMLIPIFFKDVDLSQILVSRHDLNDKFNRFFTSAFRIKSVSWLSQDAYNLNEVFVVSLDKEIDVTEGIKRNGCLKTESKNKKFTHLLGNHRAKIWSKIEHYSNIVKLSSSEEGTESQIIYADKNIIDRFRLELLKEDHNIKNQFLNHFLFCNTFPSSPINSVSVQRLKKGQYIKGFEQKVLIIFQGSIIQQTSLKNVQNNKNKSFGQKWRFHLVRGSLICKANLKSLLEDSHKSLHHESKYIQNYSLLTDSIFLTIPHSQLVKIIKTEKKILCKLITDNIKNIEQTHQDFIRKSIAAQQVMNEAENCPPQFHYSIPRNRKSKAFRKRTQFKQNNYEEFITLNRYEKMTQNKENVERRHLAYQQIKSQMREKQKQERFLKKIKTEKGQKELKKCEYQARLKQSKIQNLAIKDSILNTEKFRDRPNEVKFIFEEDIVQKYISLGTQKRINSSNHKKNKFVSMMEFSQQKSQSRHSKADFKAEFFEQLRKPKSRKNSRFYNKSVKFLQCESTPDIIDTSTAPLKKMI